VGPGNAQLQEVLVVNIKKPKYNFTVITLTRVLSTLWTKNDLIFIPGCSIISFCGPACWKGSNVWRPLYGSSPLPGWFPARAVAGHLTDFAGRCSDLTTGARSALETYYRIDQRRVKNNRDSENLKQRCLQYRTHEWHHIRLTGSVDRGDVAGKV
jgi:hypothetical protein